MQHGNDLIRRMSEMLNSRTSRRTLLHRAVGVAIGVPTVSSLLAACGGDDEDDDSGANEELATEGDATTEESAAANSATEAPVTEDTATEDQSAEDIATDEPAAEDAPEGATLVSSLAGEIVNLDTHHSGGNRDNIISKNIYSRLVFAQRISENEDELIPDLATEWEISDDGLEIIFHLQEGVQWHRDYGELTAADVVFTLNRVRDPDTASRWQADYANVIEVVDEDPYTVRVVLESPDPMLLHTSFSRTGFILNEQALADGGDDYSSNAIGTGPYIFESWTKGEQVELVRNDGHWLLQPDSNVERAIFRFLEDDLSAQLAFEAGELDVGYVEQPESQVALIDNPDLITSVRAHTRTHNIEPGPVEQGHILHDVNFRRALSLAINRQELADEVMLGMAQPAHTVLNPNHYGYVEEELYPFYYDPEEAQKLLDETAYDGSTLEFLSSSDTAYVNLGVIVQASWRAIGIETELIPLENAIYVERRNNGEFVLFNLGGARDYPEQIIYPQFTSDGIPTNNQWGYTGVDALAEELRFEQDFDRRAELIDEIQRQIAEDVPFIPLVYPQLTWVQQQNIEISFFPTVAEIPLWHIRVNG